MVLSAKKSLQLHQCSSTLILYPLQLQFYLQRLKRKFRRTLLDFENGLASALLSGLLEKVSQIRVIFSHFQCILKRQVMNFCRIEGFNLFATVNFCHQLYLEERLIDQKNVLSNAKTAISDFLRFISCKRQI